MLLSETTTALVRDELPAGVSLLDLGRHLLKDIHRPERICQLVIEGLPAEFPPLTSLGALPPEGGAPAAAGGRLPLPRPVRLPEVDAPFYCGREAFVDPWSRPSGARTLMAVIVGSSGSGKSSALFAGLLPRLRKEGGWQFALLRPGSQPFYALAGALLPLLEPGLSETDRLAETRKLAERLARKEVSLAQVVERIHEKSPGYPADPAGGGPVRGAVHPVPGCPDRSRPSSTSCWRRRRRARAAGRPPCVILLTLRADFMGQALAHRPFADALQEGSLLMGPMTRAGAARGHREAGRDAGGSLRGGAGGAHPGRRGREARQPAAAGVHADAAVGAADRRLADAHAITRRWAAWRARWRPTPTRCTPSWQPDEQERARRALVQLVRPGEGTEDTRRMATREELGDDNWKLIQHLADRRLVVTGRDAAGTRRPRWCTRR